MKAAMLLLLAFALAGYALRPAVSQTDDAANSSADHARVFITDSQSWEVGKS